MITGLLTAIVIFLIEIILRNKTGKTLLEHIEQKVEQKTAPKGEVIFPTDDTAESISKKIKKADKENKDLKLEEL